MPKTHLHQQCGRQSSNKYMRKSTTSPISATASTNRGARPSYVDSRRHQRVTKKASRLRRTHYSVPRGSQANLVSRRTTKLASRSSRSHRTTILVHARSCAQELVRHNSKLKTMATSAKAPQLVAKSRRSLSWIDLRLYSNHLLYFRPWYRYNLAYHRNTPGFADFSSNEANTRRMTCISHARASVEM